MSSKPVTPTEPQMPKKLLTLEEATKLSDTLEEKELMGIDDLTPEEYAKLTALYVSQMELFTVKLLWIRTPMVAKTAMPDITRMYEVGNALYAGRYTLAFSILNKWEWHQDLVPLIAYVRESLRTRILDMYSRAFSSINLEKFKRNLGINTEEALKIVSTLGWKITDNWVYLKPKPKPSITFRFL